MRSARRTARPGTIDDAAAIVHTILGDWNGDVAVRLWDGRIVHGTEEAPCTLVFHEPGPLRELVLWQSLPKLAQRYLSGAVAVEGEMERLFTMVDHLLTLKLSATAKLELLKRALRLPPTTHQRFDEKREAGWWARRNSRASIAHHYDVGNDFYRLWLDPEMVYSCAYFRNVGQSLAEAQRDKLEYICRKLRLQPGQTLLDIGCGWGALALWAARHHGVRVRGITLSEQQQRLARARVRDAGLEGRVKIELRDYRQLPPHARYDRVVSVGMFEHVGVRNFPRYFSTVRRVLKPGGLFLNHGITSKTGWQRTPLTRFMNRYIFPDGELARVSDVADAMERAGFELLDIENLRRHYAMTLRHWIAALEAQREAAVRHSSATTYRLWRLYMAGCAYYFDDGWIGLHQILAGHQHAPLAVPLRRDDLYRAAQTPEAAA